MNKFIVEIFELSYLQWTSMASKLTTLEVKRFRKEEIRKRVKKTLNTVGLEGLENRLAPQLSGGQQQRVALASALII